MTRSTFVRSAVALAAATTLLVAGAWAGSDDNGERTLSAEEAAYIFGGQIANRQCGAVAECQSTSSCTVLEKAQCTGEQRIRIEEANGKACNINALEYVCEESLPNEDCSVKYTCAWDARIGLCTATLPAAGFGRAPKGCGHAIVP